MKQQTNKTETAGTNHKNMQMSKATFRKANANVSVSWPLDVDVLINFTSTPQMEKSQLILSMLRQQVHFRDRSVSKTSKKTFSLLVVLMSMKP